MNELSSTKKLLVPFAERQLVADVMGKDPRILFLHGAGSSKRQRAQVVRDHLLAQGIGSVAFDCIGHGETGGDLLGSSLRSRTEQALEIIKQLELQEPLTIMGSSMGGYTALKLSECVAVDTLVLFVPAAYTPQAYDVPFGSDFSLSIRAQDSWQKSDAWEILHRFTGKLLIVAGAKDDKIPFPVIEKMYASADLTKHRELLVLPNADHGIMQHITANAPDRQVVLEAVDRLLAA